MDKALTFVCTVLRALRPHHWVKNLLVFAPLLAAQRWDEPALWASAGLAFVAFSLCSSAVYLTNDLMDINDDRAHPVKRHRPLASGLLRPGPAIWVAVLLIVLASVLAATSGAGSVLALYVLGSLAYSGWLKTLRGVDLLALVGLYSLRLLAGGQATGIPVSGWLLAYGGTVFASLALAKRSAELGDAVAGVLPLPKRRGYQVRDRAVLTVIGLIAALGSLVVLMLYGTDAQTKELYDRPALDRKSVV